MTSFDIDKIDPVTLLFQAGYLTIKEVRRRGTFVSYILGFPNVEVSSAFTSSLLDLFSETFQRNEIQGNIYFSLEDGGMEGFKAAIHALLAAIPYHNYTNNDIARYEGFYASVIFAWLSSIGVVLIVEDCTNKGRIDMSVEMNETIYLIEFKVDMPEQKPLAQIKSKGYAEKYQTKGKKDCDDRHLLFQRRKKCDRIYLGRSGINITLFPSKFDSSRKKKKPPGSEPLKITLRRQHS